MTLRSETTEDDAVEDEKAVLFCPDCRYRGPWTDWCPGEDAHGLRCPACGAPIG